MQTVYPQLSHIREWGQVLNLATAEYKKKRKEVTRERCKDINTCQAHLIVGTVHIINNDFVDSANKLSKLKKNNECTCKQFIFKS